MLKLDQLYNCVWDFITNNENEGKNYKSSLIFFFCLNLYNQVGIISLKIPTILLTFLQKLLW